ncbi:MAG: 3-dehydroquinate synthase [Clostridia bacterium]|nr:3-dehydroquinate synthase [Clostridia bacterium]
MTNVEVKLNNPYSVVIGMGLLSTLGERVRSVTKAKKVLVVTDSNVSALYLDGVKSSLHSAGFEVFDFVFMAGEKSKTPATYLDIINCLGSYGFKRTDAIVALGGGVVGDIAGFAAATYMRGIDYVQVPTTLLAMIDSSVGGKTGVDLPFGKNLLGAFWQPKAVIADISTLETLPEREWKTGIGEGIKYACLAGGRILEILLDDIKGNLEEFVRLCVEYKASVVVEDEKESGLRKLLNLGHTVGHAIEKQSNFEIPHGVAVARGVAIMANAAYADGELDSAERDIILSLLTKYGIELPCASSDMTEDSNMSEAFAMDKKAEGDGDISAVVIRGLGKCEVRKMQIEQFKEYINRA